MDKTIAIRVDSIFHKQIRMRVAENGMSLKDYIIHLIVNDLKDNEPLLSAKIPADTAISEESIREAQKILDFVRDMLSLRT